MTLLLLLAACGGDDVTTERTFVGRVHGPGGTPLPGLLVESMEAQSTTDEAGRFAVKIKPHAGLAHFTLKGTWYRHKLQEADLGQVVDLAVPEVREVQLTCPPVACSLQLRWPLSEGFEAQVRPRCEAGATVAIEAVPAGLPEVVCTTGKGREKRVLPFAAVEQGEGIAIVEQGTPVQVELRPVDGALPEDCRVRVGDRVAAATGPGTWSAQVGASGAEGVTVGAQCGDTPAVPVRVVPGELNGEPVRLEWAAQGPSLDLASDAAWAAEVVLAVEGPAGWSLNLAPSDSGIVQLPPLPAGAYRVMVRSEEADLPLVAPPPEGEPGVLAFAEAGEGAMVGRLVLTEDLEGGPVRIRVAR